MADTIITHRPNSTCADCGRKGTSFVHWGPFVPHHEILYLCSACMERREDYYNEHGAPKPVGKKA